MGEIALLGLEFYGRHGVMPEEGRLGARFVVDLWLEVPFEGKGDRLEETVDYALVYALVEEVVRHRRFYLIEALADHLAEALLEAFPRLTGMGAWGLWTRTLTAWRRGKASMRASARWSARASIR
jgi:dihydroneopterin aldolase